MPVFITSEGRQVRIWGKMIVKYWEKKKPDGTISVVNSNKGLNITIL